MNRNEYIRRVLPFLSSTSEENADKVMDTIAQYLVDAGEENEEAALSALGTPEALGMRIAAQGSSFKLEPFAKPPQLQKKETVQAEHKAPSQKIDTKKDYSSYVPESKPRKKKDTKKMALILGVLVITSPIWGLVTLIFLALGLMLSLLVAAALLTMTVGGAVMVVLGAMKLFSILPVGLMLTGAGLLLLGIALIAFLPLLRSSVKLCSEVFYDIREFVARIFRLADSAEVEV